MKPSNVIKPQNVQSPGLPIVYSIAQAEIAKLEEAIKKLAQFHESGQLSSQEGVELLLTQWEAGRAVIRRVHRTQALRHPPSESKS